MNTVRSSGSAAMTRWGLVAMLGFLAVAAVLRFGWLGHQIPVDDEWHALHMVILHPWQEIATRFGHADHSIPIALMLEFLAESRGLNEWNLGLPFALAGLISVWLIPYLLRAGLTPSERVLLTGLLAVSPLLFYYSQQARPYAPLTVLAPIALVCLWRLLDRMDWKLVVGFAVSGAISVWLHPMMLVWLCWALLVAALMVLFGWGVPRSVHAAGRMVLAGFGFAILAGALLAAPLINDINALLVKTGVGRLTVEGAISALRMAFGVGNGLVLALLSALAVWGGVVVARRGQGAVLGWLVALSIGSLAMIAMTNATWLEHGMVLIRYSVPAQLGLLVLLAVGACDLSARIVRRRPVVETAAIPVLLVLLLFHAGPLPRTLAAPNSMVDHLYWLFEYNDEANKVKQFADRHGPTEVDRRIGEATGPGRVWFGPWRFESTRNVLALSQRVQNRRVGIVMLTGSCFDFARGEFPDDERFRMNWMVPFARLGTVLEPGDFVVLAKGTHLPPTREFDDYRACLDQARARFGPPWYEDELRLAFRIGPGRG